MGESKYSFIIIPYVPAMERKNARQFISITCEIHFKPLIAKYIEEHNIV